MNSKNQKINSCEAEISDGSLWREASGQVSKIEIDNSFLRD
jgi:hypothetical protein